MERKFIEAIALKRMIRAQYNGNEMHLAPHMLFSRHGDLFISALNTLKNWRSDEDRRLTQYKLLGLSEVVLTDETFEPLPGFDGAVPRETDISLFAIA